MGEISREYRNYKSIHKDVKGKLCDKFARENLGTEFMEENLNKFKTLNEIFINIFRSNSKEKIQVFFGKNLYKYFLVKALETVCRNLEKLLMGHESRQENR